MTNAEEKGGQLSRKRGLGSERVQSEALGALPNEKWVLDWMAGRASEVHGKHARRNEKRKKAVAFCQLILGQKGGPLKNIKTTPVPGG